MPNRVFKCLPIARHPPLECQLVEDAVNCALKAGMDHALLQTIKAEVAVHHHALLAASSLSALTEDKLKDMLSGKAKLPAGDPFIALAEAMYSVYNGFDVVVTSC